MPKSHIVNKSPCSQMPVLYMASILLYWKPRHVKQEVVFFIQEMAYTISHMEEIRSNNEYVLICFVCDMLKLISCLHQATSCLMEVVSNTEALNLVFGCRVCPKNKRHPDIQGTVCQPVSKTQYSIFR